MKTEGESVIYYDNFSIKVFIVLGAILFCSSIVFIVLGIIFHFAFLILGSILLFIILITVLYSIFFSKVFIVLNSESIQITTMIGKIRKEKSWNDLQSIVIKKQKIKGTRSALVNDKYICLVFSKDVVISDDLQDSRWDDNLIVIFYTKEKLELIMKYTNLPVTNLTHKI